MEKLLGDKLLRQNLGITEICANSWLRIMIIYAQTLD